LFFSQLSNPAWRNASENIRPITPADQMPPGLTEEPKIGSLRLSESLPIDVETHSGPTPKINSKSDDISELRMFGKNMRRLVKIVHQAIMNPCEYNSPRESYKPKLMYQMQCMFLGMLNNTIWNVSKVGQRNVKRTCINSPVHHLGVTTSL
jgi:hypothetical protein